MKTNIEIKPAVCIYFDDKNGVQIPLKKIKEGLEEDQVPWEERQVSGSVSKIALQAAVDSRIGIGIGIVSEGTCLLQQRRLSPTNPIMRILSGSHTMDDYRILGSNAARLAKIMPLKGF